MNAQRLKKRFKKASDAELKAKEFLKQKGFTILEAQKEFRYEILENRVPITIKLKVDFLVSKNGYSYVVEVKSGNQVNKITHSATRRQILEYQNAIDVHGVYLLDMTNQELKQIEFPKKHRFSISLFWLILYSIMGSWAIFSSDFYVKSTALIVILLPTLIFLFQKKTKLN